VQFQGCRKAEIIPFEPDPGNAGEGSELRKLANLTIKTFPKALSSNKIKNKNLLEE